MTKQDFILKWNIAYEDKEQESEFAQEMQADIERMIFKAVAPENLSQPLRCWSGGYKPTESTANIAPPKGGSGVVLIPNDTPTLRDQFAMSASEEDIQHIIQANSEYKHGEGFGEGHYEYKVTRYQARYIYADKMLTQRKETYATD